jgi:hypothetical protein
MLSVSFPEQCWEISFEYRSYAVTLSLDGISCSAKSSLFCNVPKALDLRIDVFHL